MSTPLPPPTLEQVEEFLRRLHDLMGRENPQILFRDDRPKNVQALLTLKLKRLDRTTYITQLTPIHTCQLHQSDYAQEAVAQRHLWVFGMLVGKKRRPAYIKIQLGATNAAPICISFHPPEFQLDFLFPSAFSQEFERAYHAQSSHR